MLIGMLVLGSMSCNLLLGFLPGGEATPTQEGTAIETAADTLQTPQPAEADYYDIDGNPVDYEPAPQESLELMLAEVESGDLELEEGVLQLMRVMVGDGSIPGYTQDVEGGAEFKSGWGLSLLAYQLYQQSDDPELRAELERLHRRLAPPREALRRYAQLVEEPQSSNLGHLMSPSKQTECSQIWEEGFPETDGPAPICLHYAQFIVGLNTYDVYYPVEMEQQLASQGYLDAAIQALADSHSRYSEYFELRSIDLVFSPIEATDIGGPVGGSAFVPVLNAEEMGDKACPITMVAGALDEDLAVFKQIVAHEVFHCVHLWRKGFSGYTETSWYNEGLANYFSNVVYPNANAEWDSVHKFHGASIYSSIFEMTYENTVFYQYLGNQFGNEWLVDFIDDLPSSDRSGMLSHVSGLDGIDEIFHEFGQAYMEGKIADTGGGPLPGTALVPPETNMIIPSDGSYQLEAKPFQVARAHVLIEPKTRIEFSIDQEGERAMEGVRRLGEDEWLPFPNPVSTCEDPLSFQQILTSTETGAYTANVASFEPTVDLEEENDCDQCLIGVWRHDNAGSDYWDHVMQESADRQTYLDQVSGTHTLTFFEDGTYRSFSDDFMTIWAGKPVEGNVTEVQTTVEVDTLGNYNTPGESLLQLVEDQVQYRSEVVTVVSGPLGTFSSDPIVNTEPEAGDPMTAEGAPYSCEGDTLEIFHEDPGWNWSGYYQYSRVSSDPTSFNQQP
jgi:hypothetical protein